MKIWEERVKYLTVINIKHQKKKEYFIIATIQPNYILKHQ